LNHEVTKTRRRKKGVAQKISRQGAKARRRRREEELTLIGRMKRIGNEMEKRGKKRGGSARRISREGFEARLEKLIDAECTGAKGKAERRDS